MLESPTPISLSTVRNRALRHSSRNDPPSYPRLSRFICVHQRPWVFLETFRLAKPKRERGPMGREERHYFDPWQDVYFPRGSKKSVRLPSFTDGRRSMQLEMEWLQRRRPDGSRPS